MKKLLLLVGLVVMLGISLFFSQHSQLTTIQSRTTHTISGSITPTPTIAPVKVTNTMLFVPYWTLGNTLDPTYSEYIYFGVTPGNTGIKKNESGYQGIQTFLHGVPPDAKKLLGVRMINNSSNEEILHNNDLQQKIITDAITLAQRNGFDGIVLDLEYSAFPFDSVIQSVQDFSKRFADGVKARHLLFYQTLYGDTFYRGRPYTVKDLAKNADKILVMAYDFHKANGDPGANFPFELGSDEYSFTEMVNNFLKEVPQSKLSVIFGMFGYDWQLNDKGKSVGQAQSLSDNEILQKFLRHCQFKNCSITQNASLETKVTYEDAQEQQHEVWFEDTSSVGKKEDMLEKNGVSSVGFWANGYF